ISNRIFEITSVGAIAFCCDIPWIRKHFGDTVYYFDQHLSDKALSDAILTLRETVYKDPETAVEKARRARAIFESRFAGEVMIESAVKYHETLSNLRTARDAGHTYTPFISVVLRCGSRPIEYLERA